MLLAASVNAGIFHLLFRRQLPRRFNADAPLQTPSAPKTRLERVLIVGLALVALAYVAGAKLGIDTYWVTLTGGSLLAGVAIVARRVTLLDLRRAQPQSLYAFVVGLALVVAAVDRTGLLDMLGRLITHAAQAGPASGLLPLTFGTALGTNLVNNWTMGLAIVPSLQRPSVGERPVFGSLLGADMIDGLSS